MKKTLAVLLTMFLLFSLTVTACNGQTESSGGSEAPSSQSPVPSQPVQSSESSKTPEESSSPSSVPEETDNEVISYYLNKANEVVVTDTHVTFTDDSGRGEISVAKKPQKVAVLYGSLACLWYEAGGTVQAAIGGKSSTALYQEQIGHDITQDEGVAVVSESFSGTRWDGERILAEQPDLIICSTGMKGYETISGPANSAGIPVIGIDYDSVRDYLKWFKVFCNLNGQPELWDSVADQTAQSIIDIVSRVPKDTESPRAVILVLSSDVLKAYTGASQPGVILKELGGVNLVDEDNSQSASSVEINMEDLYALAPDMIFLSEFGETNLETLNELYGNDPVWQSLDAVKEGRLYGLEKVLFHNKANRNYNKAYQFMANLLYPNSGF